MRNSRSCITVFMMFLLGWSASAHAAVRAVFVGIDHYRYSRTHQPLADFNDLRGAVGDVGRIKAALRQAYGLDLDVSANNGCSHNAISTTLIDACATHDAILSALDERIKASQPGDTLIFYFAGHGSQFDDDMALDQASGRSDTILPVDARAPGANTVNDILDRQLRLIIDDATAAGVNVITIFDSCHSGTGVRGEAGDGENRVAPPLVVHGLRAADIIGARSPTKPQDNKSLGYRVHLAAAADEEEARETGSSDGTRAGVFTSALVETLLAIPHATFADIAAEIQLKVAEKGHISQHPQAEGSLNATLGGTAQRVALLTASPMSATQVSIAAGSLSGITEGSTYALYANVTTALDAHAQPLASGHIEMVENYTARLLLDAPANLPQRLVAREQVHAFGKLHLFVRLNIASSAARAGFASALKATPFASIGEPAQLIATVYGGGDGPVVLFTSDGTGIASLPPVADANFADQLRDTLQRVARVQALLALRSDPSRADLSFCIDSSDYPDIYTCPPQQTKERVLALNVPAKLAVQNKRDMPRYVYVFGIDEQYSVTLLLPPSGTRDPALGPQQALARGNIKPRTPGRYYFLTLATDAPIDAAALEQSGSGARDPGSCTSTLEKLLCSAATGTRDPATPRVGSWAAIVSSVIVQ